MLSKVPLSGIDFINNALSKFADLNNAILEAEIAKFNKAKAEKLQKEMQKVKQLQKAEVANISLQLQEAKKQEGGLLRTI